MDGAIIPISNLNNRSQKRKFTKEAIKIAGKLEEVNTAFLWHLFNTEGKSYREMYLHYLKEWNDTVDALVIGKKINNLAIDRLFFERQYKPQFYIK
jgi:hypothetical protein|tara:strand:- start:37 stop:324 length:288 start_codon:yes stop_codon:yes gene_type:complete